MQANKKLHLQSMYLSQPMLLAHVITLELEPDDQNGFQGQLHLDPNLCDLDLWGDRGACTKMAIRTVEITVTRMRTEDPHGRGRVHYDVTSPAEELDRRRLNLIEYPDANLWYFVLEQHGIGDSVIPLFLAKLFGG